MPSITCQSVRLQRCGVTEERLARTGWRQCFAARHGAGLRDVREWRLCRQTLRDRFDNRPDGEIALPGRSVRRLSECEPGEEDADAADCPRYPVHVCQTRQGSRHADRPGSKPRRAGQHVHEPVSWINRRRHGIDDIYLEDARRRQLSLEQMADLGESYQPRRDDRAGAVRGCQRICAERIISAAKRVPYPGRDARCHSTWHRRVRAACLAAPTCPARPVHRTTVATRGLPDSTPTWLAIVWVGYDDDSALGSARGRVTHCVAYLDRVCEAGLPGVYPIIVWTYPTASSACVSQGHDRLPGERLHTVRRRYVRVLPRRHMCRSAKIDDARTGHFQYVLTKNGRLF